MVFQGIRMPPICDGRLGVYVQKGGGKVLGMLMLCSDYFECSVSFIFV